MLAGHTVARVDIASVAACKPIKSLAVNRSDRCVVKEAVGTQELENRHAGHHPSCTEPQSHCWVPPQRWAEQRGQAG